MRACVLAIGCALISTATLTGRAAAQPPTPDPPATMLVFDGSGSMWARLDGDKQAKFYLARDALKTALTNAPQTSRVGLVAYGHRRQGDCSDVQVHMAPEPQSGGDKLLTLIEKHNPRGKSPLTTALREAVKALPKGDGPRSLLVVHDDLDNCNQDPCSALADLRAAVPNLVIHSLGLGLKGDDSQLLQCLVRPTGGRLIDVQSGSGIAAAADELVKLVSLEARRPPGPSAKAAPQAPALQSAPQPVTGRAVAPARPPLRKTGPPALRLATLLQAGATPSPREVHWIIRPADASAASTPFSAVGQDVSVAVPAGAYMVEARDGLVRAPAHAVVVAAQGETGLDVTLSAGVVRAVFTGTSSLSRVHIINPEAPAAIVPAERLAVGIALPIGRWLIHLAEGQVSKDIPIEIKAGETVDLGTSWPFGRLNVTLGGDAGTSRFPSVIIVYEDDPESPRGRRELQRSASGDGTLVLPAGTYTIVARQGTTEVRERISLQAGETVRRALTLAVARVTLASKVPGAAAVPPGTTPDSVAYRLERLDVVPPEVFTANRQVAELDLPAGRYRIEARHGLVNARAAREVTIAAGAASTVTLDQQAGTVRLVGPAGALGDLLWEILDETGHPLWSTAQTSPVAILQAGRYIVRLDHRGKRLERRLDVRVGDNRLVEVKE